jgi:type II secretory pathway pseudopilin PulG
MVNQPRGGFSLFEVMISLAVLVAGLALILQMLASSQTFARRATEAATAQVICQNKLNRIAVGLDFWNEIRQEECEENPDFWYSVKSADHGMLPLRLVEVSVWPKTPRERGAVGPAAGTDTDRLPGGTVVLSRWLPQDPAALENRLVPTSAGTGEAQ